MILPTTRLLGFALRRSVPLRPFSKQHDFTAVKEMLLKTYNDLNTTVLSQDPNNLPKDLLARLGRLKPIGDHLLTLEVLQTSQEATTSMMKELVGSDEEDLRELAEIERVERESQMKAIDEEIMSLLVPPEPYDDCAVTLEISAGIGGQEAMLFADELFKMYSRFAAWKGWGVEDVVETYSDIGGLRAGSMTVYGHLAYRFLKFESGIHRVQRVPLTGKKLHTSTAAVFVLPLPEEVNVVLDPAELKFESFHSSGPGGQHVNKTSSAVRLTHLPTGITVECQETKLQQKNREIAMERLRLKLEQQKVAAQVAEVTANRRLQVGSRERSDKIRTYNFPQDRLTDHRLQRSWLNMQHVLNNPKELQPVFEALRETAEEERVQEILSRLLNQGWS